MIPVNQFYRKSEILEKFSARTKTRGIRSGTNDREKGGNYAGGTNFSIFGKQGRTFG